MANPQPIKQAKKTRIKAPPGPYDIAPKGETDEAKKLRLAKRREYKLVQLSNKRVPKALNAIELIGNLATYKPTTADIDAIEQALGESCVLVIQRLRGAKREKAHFTLREINPS